MLVYEGWSPTLKVWKQELSELQFMQTLNIIPYIFAIILLCFAIRNIKKSAVTEFSLDIGKVIAIVLTFALFVFSFFTRDLIGILNNLVYKVNSQTLRNVFEITSKLMEWLGYVTLMVIT